MTKTVKVARKIGVLVVGLPIFVIGVILVPLPGPGLLIMFAGLFIISLEFDWAKKHVDAIRDKLIAMKDLAQKKAKSRQ